MNTKINTRLSKLESTLDEMKGEVGEIRQELDRDEWVPNVGEWLYHYKTKKVFNVHSVASLWQHEGGYAVNYRPATTQEIIQEIAEFEVGQEVYNQDIMDFATIESRHLAGTSDVNYRFKGVEGYFHQNQLERRPRPKWKEGDEVWHTELEKNKRTPKAGEVWEVDGHDAARVLILDKCSVRFWPTSREVELRDVDPEEEVERFTKYLGTFSEVFHTLEEINKAYKGASPLGSPLHKTFINNLKKKE
jgi:hypothetical protein